MHKVPFILVGSKGKSSIPSNLIGTISKLLSFKISFTIFSFSTSNIEHVEYTNSFPILISFVAFLSKELWALIDFSISFYVKYFSILLS